MPANVCKSQKKAVLQQHSRKTINELGKQETYKEKRALLLNSRTIEQLAEYECGPRVVVSKSNTNMLQQGHNSRNNGVFSS